MTRPPLDPLARELSVIRQAAGLSMYQVAERMGCCYQRISDFESGKRHFTAATLHRWAAALGCRVVLVPEETVGPEMEDGGLR